MNRYKENNCRICRKVFCCKKCREQHETLFHKIFVDCNICLYGKTFLRKDLTESLIKHIKNQHWPLHCVNCKKSFESSEELLKQHMCQVDKNQNFEKSPYTPIQLQVENKCYLLKGEQSNPNMFCNLATSTPLQRGDEISLPEKSHNQEVITPVEFLDVNKDKKYTDCISIKRKVTFCETPIAETNETEESILETENKYDQIISTPSCSGDTSAVFYSAKQYLHENSTYQGEKNEIGSICTSSEHKINGDIKGTNVEQEESILWISAVNTPSSKILDENKPLVNINVPTPVIAKLKKKQVNVVVPTAIRKQNVELELPSNLHYEESTSEAELNSSDSNQILKEVYINNADSSSTDNTNGILSETSLNAPGSLWTSMSKLIKSVANAVHELSNTSYKTPLKRCILEDDLLYEPCAKRYKLTDIKCRRPIRQLAVEYLGEYNKDESSSKSITYVIKKKFVDKSTQTDEEFS